MSSGAGTPPRDTRQVAEAVLLPSLWTVTVTATLPSGRRLTPLSWLVKGPTPASASRPSSARPMKPDDDPAQDRGVELRRPRRADVAGVVLVAQAHAERRGLAAALARLVRHLEEFELLGRQADLGHRAQPTPGAPRAARDGLELVGTDVSR